MKQLRGKKFLSILLAASPLLFMGLAFGQFPEGKVYLDLYSPAARKLPVAIPAFRYLGQGMEGGVLGIKLSQVISDDLGASGLFRVIDPAAYLEDPQSAGLSLGEQNFRDWVILGAEALIKGGYSLDGKGILRMQGRLFDVLRRTQELSKELDKPASRYRRLAHQFADEIILKFTGEPGVFNTRVAFVNRRTGNKELFLMDFDGYNMVQLTANRSINLSPVWSPDGESLAYISYKDGAAGIFIRNLRTGSEWKVRWRRGAAIGAAWAPDGKRLALALGVGDNFEIFLMELASRKLRRLTRHWAIDVNPSWSPDGRFIAFVSSRPGSPQIYIMDAEGGNLSRVSFEGEYNSTPAWSPRGNRIAFASRKEGGKAFDIYLIQPDGSGLQQLTAHAGDNQEPSWSPDGRHLLFSSTREGYSAIYRMTAFGENLKRLGPGSEPSWSPRLP